MKENENENENEMKYIGEPESPQNPQITQTITQSNDDSVQDHSIRLESICGLVNQNEAEPNNQQEQPQLVSMDSILRGSFDGSNIDQNLSFDEDNKDISLAKVIYNVKEFIFMFCLFLSPILNFSWGYGPFLLLGIFCYFLLYKSTILTKKLKKIIEILSLVYSLILLGVKIYFIITIKGGNNFENHKDLLIKIGIKILINIESNFYLILTFISECFIIVLSIISIIISSVCSDFDTSDKLKKDEKIERKEFYGLMTRLIYFCYFNIFGFAIFNRSLLTLCYIAPMNIVLFIMAMNFRKKRIFYIYKTISFIMILAITAQILTIYFTNIYNDKYFDFKDFKYNFLTKIGVNCAFKEDMSNIDIWIEFFAYFFCVSSLISLCLGFTKLTKEKLEHVVDRIKNLTDEKGEEEIDLYEDVNDESMINEKDGFFQVILNKIKDFISYLLEKIQDYFTSPGFILHICRVSAIFWLYFYRNYFSIGVVIWLFFAFLYLHVKSNKICTIFFLAPMIIISLICFHYANIDGFCEDTKDDLNYIYWGLGKFTHKHIEYILCNVFYFFVTLFIYSLYKRQAIKTEKPSTENKDEKKTEKKLEKLNEIIESTENRQQTSEALMNESDNNIENENNIDNNIDNINTNNNIDNENKINVPDLENNNETNDNILPASNENDNIIIKDDEKNEADKEIDELLNNLTLFNIILKSIFSNIDKITLVVLYFLSVNSINVMHFIFVFLFMLQLLCSNFMINHSCALLVITQISFSIEYLIDLFKNIIPKLSEETIKFYIPFSIDDKNSSVEFFIYGLVYCYYVQYQLLNYSVYRKITLDKNISLTNYIELKLINFNILKQILFSIGNIILEIYVWSLIVLFVIFDSYFEISAIFCLKLLLFFIIVFQFVHSVQTSKAKHISMCLIWLFIAICSLNTVAVYIYQLICVKIGKDINKSKNPYIKNFPAYGLYQYNEKNLYLNFLPHFICNFIAILYLNEMKRILTKYDDSIDNQISNMELNNLNETRDKLIEKEKNIRIKKNSQYVKAKKVEDNKDANININNEIANVENSNAESEKIEKENLLELEKVSNLEKYEKNIDTMNILNFKNFLFNIVLICAKFYWLFLFLFICLIFTIYSLSFLIVLYLIIFGITFIAIFNHTIIKLNNFTKKESFYISKLLRYNLIEKSRHVLQNKAHISVSFQFLLSCSFLSFLLLYLYAIFYILQNGCQKDNCDNKHSPIIDDSSKLDKIFIQSLAYLIGFYVDLKKGSLLYWGWLHLVFSLLIGFDVYVQKAENYFNDLAAQNRKLYRKLANENINLKSLVSGEEKEEENDENIDENNDINTNNNNTSIRSSKKKIQTRKTINFKIDVESKEEEERIGRKLIDDFLSIFKRATSNEVKLQSSNNTTTLIFVIKKIFEEIIVFLLICTAISKSNIWSIIYLLLSINLILTKKTMMKYYVSFCFVISAILLQSIFFVSNLQESTNPNQDSDILEIIENIKKKLNIPWIDNYKIGFYFGLGSSRSQIYSIWMEFVEVVIVYIYLDYFSYSIYQDNKCIGTAMDNENKINYYNLYLNDKVRHVTNTLTKEEFKAHEECMKYNFGLSIIPFDEFKFYMKKGRHKTVTDDENEINENNENEEEKEKEGPLLSSAFSKFKNVVTKKIKKDNLISKISIDENENNKFFTKLKEFIYLSFHNFILIVIIIISMMIGGLISIFYIIFSLYFLITSTGIYLGNKYYYPKAIKKILRIAILLDILIQILYQTPIINQEKKSSDTKNDTLTNILTIIGLNRYLTFSEDEEAKVDGEKLVLVFAKAFIYLFMSIQVLVYTSQNFQEFYLSYIITQNSILRRITLMNVFKFNNYRVNVMGRSIDLRQEMSKSMDALQKSLENWKQNLEKTINTEEEIIEEKNENEEKIEDKKEEEKNEENKSEEKKEEKEENLISTEKNTENKPEEKKEEKKPKAGARLLAALSKVKSVKINENVTTVSTKSKDNLANTLLRISKKDNSNANKTQLFKSLNLTAFTSAKDLEEEEEYIPKDEMEQMIKDWILSGFLIKLRLKMHRFAGDYSNIDLNEKDIYERDIIQGKTQISCFLETEIERQLKTIDLEHFTRRELKEVKSYFDGTRKEKLEKLKKEKEIIKKFQKGAEKAKKVGKLGLVDKEVIKSKENTKIRFVDLFTMKQNEEKEKDIDNKKSIIAEVKNKLLTKTNTINLNEPKFKKLEKFISNKIFLQYLKPTYIISNILRDCLSFCANNFHWVVYLVMIINHMMSSSIISMFYPLSIFCYALLEYPRPKKKYWTTCLIYTVVIFTLKFFIQLMNPIDEDFINEIEKYKVGFKTCESTFCKNFFLYILNDAIVLVFLLINDYLLVSRGLYFKREQEIETIYQANERIATTKDLEFDNLDEIQKFNESYLLDKEDELIIKNEKNIFKVNNVLKNFIKYVNKFEDKNEENKEQPPESEKTTEKKTLGFIKKFKDAKKRKEKQEIEKQESEKKTEKKEEDKNKYDESQRKYYQTLFPKVRNEKPGNEYYASYTLFMVLIIVFLLLFYTTMVEDKTFGAVSVETKQFSGTMVIFLLIHVAFLVYDRILFIKQNRNHLIYEYILYDKKSKNALNDKEFNQIKHDIINQYPEEKNKSFIIPPEYADKLKEKYNIVYIQTEEFNSPLFQKYIMQLLIVIFAHIFVFFFLPMQGNSNLYNNPLCVDEDKCYEFLDSPLIIIFYILYIIYFVGSGLQIKYGFYDMKRKSMLKSGNSSINGGIYSGFKAIPFLYEIKLAIDWTFTSTCLDLFQWNKFENVYDTIYTTYCSMTGINSKLVGQKVSKVLKIGMGGVISFGLIFVLVGPLMLFSSLNPTNKKNNLTSADLKVELCFTYSNGAFKNYTIFQNTKPESINEISDSDWEYYGYSKSTHTKNYPKDQVQTVTFFEANDRNWDLAKPHIENLITLIQNRTNDDELLSIKLVLDYSFSRPLPAETQKSEKRYDIYAIYEKGKETEIEKNNLNILEDGLDNCTNININYSKYYSPPIKLTSSLHPSRIKDDQYFNSFDIQIGFVGCKIKNKTDESDELKNQTQSKSYLESYFTFSKFIKNNDNIINNITNNITDNNKTEGIKFHVFNDKVSSTTSGYSVLTFYLSFVLLVGNYVRNFFAGQPEKIYLTEMPHPEELINLCEGIKMSRYSFDFEEEEKLYYILIEFMRSPDYLREITTSSIEQFNKRMLLNKSYKTSDDLK